MNEADLKKLAKTLSPYILEHIVNMPSYYGDRSKVKCGENVSLVNTFFNLSSGTVTIGDFTFFGNNVSILTGTHDINKKHLERHKAPKKGNDVVIGKGVWIASNSTIIGPCTIGDNSVIAAGSVLLPGIYKENSLYAGVPAVLKKKINFS